MSRHAYLIMAHHNFNQLYRLLRFLDSSENDIFLHVDQKATLFDANVAERSCVRSNVTLVPRKILSWGGDSLVKCEISLLKTALPGKYDYYHLISGEDIPLHSLEQINSFFCEHSGKEFVSINWDATSTPEHGIQNRIRYFSFFQNYAGRGLHGFQKAALKLQLILIGIQKKIGVDRCRKNSFRIGKGSQWFSITHAFAEHTVAYYESVLKSVFSFSVGADELLVQTALLNEPKYLSQLYPEGNMRLIDWSRSADGNSPHTFTAEDYEFLAGSDKLWARKVSESTDKNIIDMIYNTIANEHKE